MNKQLAEFKPKATGRPTSRLTKGIYLLLLLLMIFIPIIQINCKFDFLTGRKVAGITFPPAKMPKFSGSDFLDGKFQKKFERWFLIRHGLFGFLLRASNEITYRVFGQISPNYKSTILLGHENQLFQPMYLDAFNRRKEIDKEQIETKSTNLSEMQSELKKRGIASTLVISSNLLELYPELIPEAFTASDRLERKSNYEAMLPLLEEKGVDIVDAHQLLIEEKQNYDFRFFEPTASHWNSVGACLATKALVSRLEVLLGKALTPVNCSQIVMEDRPKEEDMDLLEITNLLFPEKVLKPAPYVESVKTEEKTTFYKPRVLFVGTSFSITLARRLAYFGVTEDVSLFFYYNKVQRKREPMRQLERHRIDWEKELAKYDAIVVEANVSRLNVAGFEFPGDLLVHLKK